MAFFSNQVLEMTVRGKASGQDILNVVHYRAVNPTTFNPAGFDVLVYLNQFALAWRAACLPVVSNTYTVQSYVATVISSTIVNPAPPPPNQFVFSEQQIRAGEPANDTGALATDPMPTFNAVGVRKFSDRPGRSFRGGLRIGPITDGQADGNELNPVELLTFANNWTTFKDTLLETAPDNEIEACVFSRTQALAAPAPNDNLREQTAKWVASLINSFVTSQVSRKQSLTATT